MIRFSKWVITSIFLLISLPIFAGEDFSPITEIPGNKLHLDKFFRIDLDVKRMIGGDKFWNLIAQTDDPSHTVSNVDDLKNYFIVWPVGPKYREVDSQFNKHQIITKQHIYSQGLVGVDLFTQGQIPGLSFQEGFRQLKFCMKGTEIPDEIARFTIYKLAGRERMVYDYVIKFPDLPPKKCREMLYVPQTNSCQEGMLVNCLIEVK